MKNISKILLIVLMCSLLLVFAACPNNGDTDPDVPADGEQNNDGQQNTDGELGDSGEEVYSMKITVGNKEFTATLYDTEAAKAFAKLLPITLDMSELNGNEKYNNLSTTLPTKTERVGNIHAGDIMLWGNNCIVLFYESFTTPYSYTKIGKIDDVTGLQQAVGRGSVTVTFSLK